MKNSGKLLTLLALALLAMACSKKQPMVAEPMAIKLALMREAIEVGEEPLTVKASGTELYAVQVYQKNGSTYDRYAYGLFDDPTTMSLNLTSGKLYRFEVTSVVNGTSLISKELITNAYRAPFTTMGTGGGNTAVGNAFTLSTSRYFNNIAKGYSAVVSGATYKNYYHPPVDRYYGELTDYAPGATAPSITLKRVVFGVKFVVEGLSEGSLSIELDKAAPVVFTAGGAAETTVLYTLENSTGDNAWTGDAYGEEIPMSIVWTKGNGVTTETIKDKNDATQYTFSRKKLYTIRIPLAPAAAAGVVSVVKENPDLSQVTEIVISR